MYGEGLPRGCWTRGMASSTGEVILVSLCVESFLERMGKV